MKKITCITSILFLVLGGIVIANTINSKKDMINKSYKNLWASVEQKETDDLPTSAIADVDMILKKAISDKNTTEAIKALIYKSKFESEINNDSATEIFEGLESLLSNTKNESDKALLNSLLSELYKNYYYANINIISQRTDLNGYIPTEINEWSANIFIDKVREHLNESVKNKEFLLKTNPDKYSTIINIGEDSEKTFPTMYDFLLNRAIDISQETYINEQTSSFNKSLAKLNYTLKELTLPTTEFIKLNFTDDTNLAPLYYISQLLKSLEARDLKEGIVFTELKRNEYLNQTFPAYNTKYSLSFLENLNDQYSSYDFSVEIINSIITGLGNTYIYQNGESVENAEKVKKVYTLLKDGINKYPNYKRINLLKDRLANLEQSQIRLDGKKTYYPSSEKLFGIKYKNVNKVSMLVYDANNKLVWNKELILDPKTTYLTYDANPILIDINTEGLYTLKFTYTNKNNRSDTRSLQFRISKLSAFSRAMGNNEYEIYVVDSQNGTPISDAKISFFTQEWSSGKSSFKPIDKAIVYTDKNGFAIYKANSDENQYNLFYAISKGNDDVKNYISLYSYFRDEETTSDKDLISIFTDRNIYRPGQTVYFKAVASNNNTLTNSQSPITNQKYTIRLLDANNQEVSQQTLSTNQFGSIAGEFILPRGGLTGNYRISINNEQIGFNVEEYKRPTFDITFDPIEGAYTFGDSVTVTGQVKSFSGIELQDINVNFSISKNPLYRFWGYGYGQGDNFDEGVVKTDRSGKFRIKFKIPREEENENSLIWMPNIFNYKIEATVTNINGETQTGYTNFNAGNVSMMLTCDLPNKIDKSSNFDFDIKAQNLSGQPIETKGKYAVYSVLENDSIDKKVLSGNFVTGTQQELKSKIVKLGSGRYTIQLETKDNQGRLVKSNAFFTLYSYNDHRPPYYTNDWIVSKNNFFDENTPAQILFGVSGTDITVLYELIKGNDILSREQLKLSNENTQLNIPYKKEYGEGIVASFTYIINGISYVRTINLNKKVTDKTLAIKWKTFRDKLRPGDQEEWSMIITRPDGKPAFAEVLASMYDASLDKLSNKDVWSSLKPYRASIWANLMSFTNLFGSETSHSTISVESYQVPPLTWNNFDWFGFNFTFQMRFMPLAVARRGAYTLKTFGSANPDMLNENIAVEDKQVSPAVPISSTIKLAQQKEDLQVRSNFAETAFFYPQLKTNSQGETIISFTVPESNTTWNFRALAYNKVFDTGRLDTTVISQKELMVTPNLPRFFRQGDKASISTAISNMSDKDLNGKVHLQFFDPLTDKDIDIQIENKYQNFSLQKGESSNATWLFTVPDDVDILGCRVIAESDSFSDGEQQAIAVLPNKMLVTESMPINMNGSQNKDFHFEALLNNSSNTLKNYRVTLEYANNPAWYAIQALPILSSAKEDNAIDNFASYYVNTLALSINKRYPKVTAMIKAWKAQSGTSETLVSQLQKNEELKAVLLEETPWVLEAKNETEQMERLALLFNLNTVDQQNATALKQLADLQNKDGGWSWFKGMYSNRSITQYILYGFSELIDLGAVEYGEKEKMMQINALKYIDQQIVNDYNSLGENNRKNMTIISTSELEYLFVRSSYRDIPISQESREAERFYNSVAVKNWTKLNLYERSLLAIVAKRNGDQELVDKIIASLRERATVSEQQGMFWANNNSTAFMSQSAVSVQTFIMNAFKEYGASAQEMNLMKQWLLSQKQTQQWESTHATIDAIYALLSTGSDWFSVDSNVKITVNKKAIETTNIQLGTGYIQKTWIDNQISKQLGNVSIDREGEGPAWGAMYWQYYENLSKIKSSEGELSVDKKLYIDSNNILMPITSYNRLKVGDKVTVRLTVKADRDMDFVVLKDQRASCFEPINVLSGTEYRNGVWFYQSTLDASTNYYFDHLPKGTYVFEYSVYVNRVGEYANGITTVQSMYAPQFVSHTEGITVKISE